MILTATAPIKRFLKHSKMSVFDGAEIGDQIKFSVEMKPVGRNRGTYATYIKCLNLRTLGESYCSFNQVNQYIFSKVEFGEQDETG